MSDMDSDNPAPALQFTEVPIPTTTLTADLVEKLRRHYSDAQNGPSGVFLTEVGWNGSASTRRCDALYMGLTSTSGRLLVGHEVKVSRQDWLRELADTTKAGEWADQCHRWWLVTLPGVVHDGELPSGWGLMYPGRGTRMKIVTTPFTYKDRVPS